MPSKRKRTERCLVCGNDQSEDPIGTAAISWSLCGVCKRWTHIQCFESDSSTEGAVTEGLWDFLHADENLLDRWNFSCSLCSETAQSIPEQLENQSLVTRQQLIDLGVDVKFLSTEINPVPVDTGAATNTGPVSTGPSTSTGTVDPAAIAPASNPPETLNITELIKFFMIQNAEEKAKQERKDEERERIRNEEKAKQERKDERQERIRNEEKAERERKDAEQERIRKEEKDERLRLEAKRDKEREEDKAEAERIRKEDKEEAKKEQMRLEAKHDMERAQKDQQSRDELRRQGQAKREDFQSGDRAPQAFADKPKGGLKLPTLPLPKFNGDPLKWLEFWDMFKATVHDNSELSPVQKLSHLKVSVEGPAKDSISQLTMTNANYDIAVELLEKRYGNKKLIKERLLRKLQSLPSSSVRLDDLRRVFHSMEQILAQLRNLDGNFAKESSEMDMLLDMIKQKFPAKIIVDIEEDEEELTPKQLMEKIEKFIKKQEREMQLKSDFGLSKNIGSSFQNPGPSTFPRTQPTFTRYQPGPVKSSFSPKPKSSADALMAASGQKNFRNDRNRTVFQLNTNNSNQIGSAGQNRKPTYPCVFCDGNHLSDDCPKYTTADLRKTQLYLGKRCYMCLKTGHTWKDCRSPEATAL